MEFSSTFFYYYYCHLSQIFISININSHKKKQFTKKAKTIKNRKSSLIFLIIISICFLSSLAIFISVFNNSSTVIQNSSIKSASVQSEAFELEYHLVVGGIGYDDYLEGMVLDQDGNLILYGDVAGNIGFIRHDPSLSLSYIPLDSTNSTVWGDGIPSALSLDSLGNIYLAGYKFPEQYLIKYSNSLVFQWNKTWGNGIPCYDMIIDSNDNIFVAGDNGGGASHGDVILMKYDSNGNELWNITSPETWPTMFILDYRVLSKDSNDNIYLVYDQYELDIEGGHYSGPVFRILKFSNSGTLLLNFTYIPSNYGENVMALRMITMDTSDNLYVLGKCFYKDDIHLLKYNNMGVLQWNQSYNFYGAYNIPREIAFDSIGNIYLLVEEDYVALAKIDPSTGNILWETSHQTLNERAYSIAFDSKNNIYVTGRTLDIETSDRDMLLIKYNSGGQLLAKNTWDFHGNETGLSIVINSNDDVFIAGNADSFFASNDYDFLLLKIFTRETTIPFGQYHLLFLCLAVVSLVFIRKKYIRT